MSVRVLSDGTDGYCLVSPKNELVGWTRGRIVGVNGFEDEHAAILAAVRSYRVLSPWLERQRLQPLPPIHDTPPRVVDDGAHRWVLVGRVPVARLVAAAEATRESVDGLSHRSAFEIVLKGAIGEGIAIHAAIIALRAAHGVIEAADLTPPPRRSSTRAVSAFTWEVP